MWKALTDSIRRLVAVPGKGVRGLLHAAQDWSRPAGVVGHAIADVRKTKTELIAENALLRQQLIVTKRQIKRALFSPSERAVTTLFARLTSSWRDAIVVVQPDTVIGWHRKLFKRVWRAKSRPKRRANANKLDKETIRLIRTMAMDNRLWGAERIRGELLKLGICVAKRTVQKYMRQARKGTSPGSQNWSTFLTNHAGEIWACDFAQTYDVLFRQIFAFVIVQHGTREVVYAAVTYHPTQEWTTQQLRNATFDKAPRFLIRDADDKFGERFDNVADGAGIEVIQSLHPNMNPVCERLIGGLRRECLDHVLLLGEAHLRGILREYVDYFNKVRPHQGIAQRIPTGARNDNLVTVGRFIARPILGGLHHDYGRAA